jgi:FG-GAP repeat protein
MVSTPVSVVVGDFNGDGVFDLAVGQQRLKHSEHLAGQRRRQLPGRPKLRSRLTSDVHRRGVHPPRPPQQSGLRVGNVTPPPVHWLIDCARESATLPPASVRARRGSGGSTCCVFRPPLNSATSELCESPSGRILLNGKTRGIWTAAFKESTSVELLPIEAVCPGLNPSCIGTPGRLLTHPARHNRGCPLLMSPRPPWQGPASLAGPGQSLWSSLEMSHSKFVSVRFPEPMFVPRVSSAVRGPLFFRRRKRS